MHNAPAVSYPVGRCRFQAAALGLLLLIVTVVMALWQHQGGVAGLLAWSSWGLVLLTTSLALASWRRTPQGRLHWDGSQWIWYGIHVPPVSGRVAVRLDWQRGLLLEFQSPISAGRWLWLDQRRDPLVWRDLRRAVFADVSGEFSASDVVHL